MNKIVVNNMEIEVPDGASVSVIGRKVYINNIETNVGEIKSNILNIECNGNLINLTSEGSVKLTGSVHGNLKADGSVNVGGSVNGNVNADGSASIGGDVGGSVKAEGSVVCKSIKNGVIM